MSGGLLQQRSVASEVASALRTTTTSVNVSNAAAPTVGQVLTATGGTAATWQTIGGGYNDFIDPCIDGDCVGDGTTNDDGPWQEIISQGYNIYLPWGKYFRLSQQTVLTKAQSIIGPGWGSAAIYWDNPTQDCVTFDPASWSNNNTLQGFYIKHYSAVVGSAPPTAGAGIAVSSPSSQVGNIRVSDVHCSYLYDGFRFTGQNNSNKFRDCSAYNTGRAGYFFDCSVPYGAGSFTNCTAGFDSAYATGRTGFLIRGLDTTDFYGTRVIGGECAVNILGSTGTCWNIMFHGLHAENQRGTGYALSVGTSTSEVRNCYVTDYHFAPADSTVKSAYIGTKAINFRLAGANISTSNGNIVDYGLRTQLLDIIAENNNSNLVGLDIYGDGTRVNGCVFPGNFTTYSSASDLDIQGNDFNGTQTIHANSWASPSIIKNNRGIADILASIGSTPLYIGQIAIVAGVGYMAVGTASAADWKQVTA